jgi:Holliday junction DNA helicase RuvB
MTDNTVDSTHLDKTLRPDEWQHYIGQTDIKENLQILLKAAKERGHAPEHLLFHGPPGLGKTTLDHLIANEIDANLQVTSGPAIEKVGDLASILTNLNEQDVLFIDEIHRLNTAIEEVLYPAMESGHLDIVVGKGPSARTIQLDLPAFTIVAATTQAAQISSPLRSRFSGGSFRLDFYDTEEIAQILDRSSDILDITADSSALKEIAKRSRYTPRTANYFLKRARDFSQLHNDSHLSKEMAEETLELLSVDDRGLRAEDRRVLETIIDKFAGGPVGLKTLAASLAEDKTTIEEVYEPYLLREGFIERTSQGRVATERAYNHLDREPEEGRQDKLDL